MSVCWCPWNRLPKGGNKVRNVLEVGGGEHSFRDQMWILVDGKTIKAHLERWFLPAVMILWCAWNYSRRLLEEQRSLEDLSVQCQKGKAQRCPRGLYVSSFHDDVKQLAIKGLKHIVVLLPLTTLITRLNKALAVCFQKRVKEEHKKVN